MKKTLLAICTILSVMILLGSCDWFDTVPSECDHNYKFTVTKEATCTEKGIEKGVCSLCQEETERETDALGHDTNKVAAKSATCTEDGWDEYEKCKRCDYSTFAKVDALGHDLEHFEAKLPTESSVGWNAYDVCKREGCGYTTYTEIPKTEGHSHAFGEWQTVAEATCTADGSKIKYCIDTDCVGEEKEIIPALGHDIKNQEEKAPTPDAVGWNAYTYCERCGEKFGYVELEKVTYYEAYESGRVVYENYSAIWNGLGKRNEGDGIVTRPGGIIVPDQTHNNYPSLWLTTVEGTANKIIKYVSAPNGKGEFDKTILLQPDGGFAKGAKYVFETDIYFSAASADVGGIQGKTFATFSFEGEGATDTSTASTRIKAAMIKDDLNNYTLFGKTVKADTWYNIRIEYDYASGIASTKINGEAAELYELKKNVDVKYIGFSMNNTLKGAYTMFDTTYMGAFGEQPENTEPTGSNDESSEILPVKGGANGIVVLVHDDGTLSSAQILDALYAKYGLCGDVAMVADRVDPSDSSKDADRLVWQNLVANGRWGVLNHSMTHTFWGNTSTGQIDTTLITKEVITSREVLKAAFPTERVLVYAYPGMAAVTSSFGDSVYDEVIKVVKKEYLAGRKWYSNGASEFYNWDWELMPTQGIDTKSENNINLINSVVSEGKFVSILMHKVLEDSDPNANKDTSNVSASVVEALCAKIAEYVNQGMLWCANYEDAVLYLMEAEKAYLEITRNKTSITATLDDRLDDELYNYPLSVRIGVPEGWKTVRYVVSGKEYLTEAKTVDGKNVIEIDLLPNGALVTITAAITEGDEALNSSYAEEIAPGVMLDKNYFPGFVRKSVTFTIDDGDIKNDPEFINIVRPAGIVGTFNLKNTDATSAANYLTIYKDYEVANHSLIHSLPNLNGVIDTLIADGKLSFDTFNSSTANRNYLYKEGIHDGVYYIDYYTYIVPDQSRAPAWHPIATDEAYMKYAAESKENIESVFGEGSVVGYAYAHGKFTPEVKAALEAAGYLYARKTGLLKATTGFAIPGDRYEWVYNADVGCLLEVMESYAAYADDGELKMFSFGVHAVDFVGKWSVLEEFAELYGDRHNEFYYATNRQIFEYEDAVKALKYENGSLVNNTDINIYVSLNGEKVIIPANSAYKVSDIAVVLPPVSDVDENGWVTRRYKK